MITLKLKREKKSRLLWVILISTLVLSLSHLGQFLYNIISEKSSPFLELGIVSSLFIFILSIVCLIVFKKNGYHKITLVLPILNIILFISSFLTGLVVGVLRIFIGFDVLLLSISPLLLYSNLIISLLEFIFASYLLRNITYD